MKILAVQMKRIGDLILTTPAFGLLKERTSAAYLTVAIHESAASLLPALPQIDAAIVFGRSRGWTPWQQVLTGGFDAVFDFTETDRSALVSVISRAGERVTFSSVTDKRWRSRGYTRFVDSQVRERHTIDHYCALAQALPGGEIPGPRAPELRVPVGGKSIQIAAGSVVVHPFTARPEKNWPPERWASVIEHCIAKGFSCVLTGGDSPDEQRHHAEIRAALERTTSGGASVLNLAGQTDLLGLADLISQAALVISCDTVAVHLAAAFQRPQIALFGPTNPFHWRPRHDRAIVISAAQPESPLTDFQPRMRGAPMERISTEVVIRVTDTLFALAP